jgi:hypothetical protein
MRLADFIVANIKAILAVACERAFGARAAKEQMSVIFRA